MQETLCYFSGGEVGSCLSVGKKSGIGEPSDPAYGSVTLGQMTAKVACRCLLNGSEPCRCLA